MMTNSPNVSSMAGKDSIITAGLITLLITEKINPANKKPKTPGELSKSLPDPNSLIANQSPSELKIQRITNTANCCFIS